MKCLSRMTGNCHVRFLGGKAVVTPLTQPIMLWAMEVVSAKMAAERGIKRVPLAVLSQSEVTRRMKSI